MIPIESVKKDAFYDVEGLGECMVVDINRDYSPPISIIDRAKKRHAVFPNELIKLTKGAYRTVTFHVRITQKKKYLSLYGHTNLRQLTHSSLEYLRTGEALAYFELPLKFFDGENLDKLYNEAYKIKSAKLADIDINGDIISEF